MTSPVRPSVYLSPTKKPVISSFFGSFTIPVLKTMAFILTFIFFQRLFHLHISLSLKDAQPALH